MLAAPQGAPSMFPSVSLMVIKNQWKYVLKSGLKKITYACRWSCADAYECAVTEQNLKPEIEVKRKGGNSALNCAGRNSKPSQLSQSSASTCCFFHGFTFVPFTAVFLYPHLSIKLRKYVEWACFPGFCVRVPRKSDRTSHKLGNRRFMIVSSPFCPEDENHTFANNKIFVERRYRISIGQILVSVPSCLFHGISISLFLMF